MKITLSIDKDTFSYSYEVGGDKGSGSNPMGVKEVELIVSLIRTLQRCRASEVRQMKEGIDDVRKRLALIVGDYDDAVKICKKTGKV